MLSSVRSNDRECAARPHDSRRVGSIRSLGGAGTIRCLLRGIDAKAPPEPEFPFGPLHQEPLSTPHLRMARFLHRTFVRLNSNNAHRRLLILKAQKETRFPSRAIQARVAGLCTPRPCRRPRGERRLRMGQGQCRPRSGISLPAPGASTLRTRLENHCHSCWTACLTRCAFHATTETAKFPGSSWPRALAARCVLTAGPRS